MPGNYEAAPKPDIKVPSDLPHLERSELEPAPRSFNPSYSRGPIDRKNISGFATAHISSHSPDGFLVAQDTIEAPMNLQPDITPKQTKRDGVFSCGDIRLTPTDTTSITPAMGNKSNVTSADVQRVAPVTSSGVRPSVGHLGPPVLAGLKSTPGTNHASRRLPEVPMTDRSGVKTFHVGGAMYCTRDHGLYTTVCEMGTLSSSLEVHRASSSSLVNPPPGPDYGPMSSDTRVDGVHMNIHNPGMTGSSGWSQTPDSVDSAHIVNLHKPSEADLAGDLGPTATMNTLLDPLARNPKPSNHEYNSPMGAGQGTTGWLTTVPDRLYDCSHPDRDITGLAKYRSMNVPNPDGNPTAGHERQPRFRCYINEAGDGMYVVDTAHIPPVRHFEPRTGSTEQIPRCAITKEREYDGEEQSVSDATSRPVPSRPSPPPRAFHTSNAPIVRTTVRRANAPHGPAQPNDRTSKRHFRVTRVLNEAVARSMAFGDPVLGLALGKLHADLDLDPTLADLLHAVVTGAATEDQLTVFVAHLKSARAEIQSAPL